MSDIGQREENQDSYYLVDFAGSPQADGALGILCVADGMGGFEGGQVASRLAVKAVQDGIVGTASVDQIRAVGEQANHDVAARAHEMGARIGTTLTIAVVEPDRVRVGHVGDSRAYLIQDGQIHQITEDHSLVGEMVAEGTLTEEEARDHPQRNVLRRAIGIEDSVEVDVFTAAMGEGDALVLCSDGLHGMVTDQEILAVVEGNAQMDVAANTLVQAALDRGGDDNITVLVWRYPGPRRPVAAQTLDGFGPFHREEPAPSAKDEFVALTVVAGAGALAGLLLGVLVRLAVG